MKIDPKSLKVIRGGVVRMNDPLRFPKVQQPLEQEMMDSYSLQLNKMTIDLTKLMTKFLK
jgi:uncharacterized beta-barrel protein YwiB (DUF1934 family)